MYQAAFAFARKLPGPTPDSCFLANTESAPCPGDDAHVVHSSLIAVLVVVSVLCRGEVGKCDTLFDLRPRIRLGPV